MFSVVTLCDGSVEEFSYPWIPMKPYTAMWAMWAMGALWVYQYQLDPSI